MALSDNRIDIPLVVGQEVAYFNPHQQMGVDNVKRSTIARILKTVVVLDNGERFRRDFLDQHNGGTWGWVVRLYHRDDPQVVEQIRKYGDRRRKDLARSAAHAYVDGKTDPKDVILAMARLLPREQRNAVERAVAGE